MGSKDERAAAWGRTRNDYTSPSTAHARRRTKAHVPYSLPRTARYAQRTHAVYVWAYVLAPRRYLTQAVLIYIVLIMSRGGCIHYRHWSTASSWAHLGEGGRSREHPLQALASIASSGANGGDIICILYRVTWMKLQNRAEGLGRRRYGVAGCLAAGGCCQGDRRYGRGSRCRGGSHD